MEAVGDPQTLIDRLRAAAGLGGTALIGFDLPIGLPRAYAEQAGIADFREVLQRLGSAEWEHFYQVSDEPSLRRPFAPRSQKGGFTRPDLAARLGLSLSELFRRCEEASTGRGRAECMFFTLGAKQVGRAVVHCWREVLAPAADMRIWPFDGPLSDLLATPGVVAVEIYPAEAAAHLGLRTGGAARWNKRKLADRVRICRLLSFKAAELGISFSASAQSQMEAGFESDDGFDAATALVSMVQVVLGRRGCDPPDDPAVSRIEGWILGQILEICEPKPEGHRTRSGRRPRYSRKSRDGCYDEFEARRMATTETRITDHDLLKLPRDGRKYELVDGAIHVSPAGARHGQVCVRLAIKLGSFVADKKLGHVLDSSTGFRLPSGNVRSPDLSFVEAGRFADERPPQGFAALAPDLAIEVLSPEDSKRAVLDKIGEYLEAGTRLVWVLDPQAGQAAVYRSLTSIRELGIDDMLDGEDVVPTFRCALRELLA